MNPFVLDIWYFVGLSTDLKPGTLTRKEITGEPITLGRHKDGTVFAMRDICPHRAAPLSSGKIIDDTVECPYHGWRFQTISGACTAIPALCAPQSFDTEKIRQRIFPIREIGSFIWIYIAEDKRFSGKPPIEPPTLPISGRKALMDDQLILNCHVDHAVIGLMDPAHGPYVHRQWWWRSEKSIHEKAKTFEPRIRGFAMIRHTPSSNSFAYKILGGTPQTEITFTLPGIRTEHIIVGTREILSFTAVTPISETRTQIRQIFFSNHSLFRTLAPLLGLFARAFLRQDANMVDLQQMGLNHTPNLMLVDDADTQAKWYFAIKKEWAAAHRDGRDFVNPVKAKTLRWRS